MSNPSVPSSPVNPVSPKPAQWQLVPPVRRPVTGQAPEAGYPDGAKDNQLGPKPIGKEGK